MTEHFCLSHGLEFLNNNKCIANRQNIEGFDTRTSSNVVSEFNTNLTNYTDSNTSLANKTQKFIDSSVPNEYTGKIIKTTNGIHGYVTDKNIFKSIPSSILASIDNTCPNTVKNADFASKSLDVGKYLGTTPNFLVGKSMTDKSVCMESGINLQINGHVDTNSLTQNWQGCYNQVGDFFNQQVDLTGGYDNKTVRRCAIRAADVGSSTFYIGKDLSSNYTCFTSKQGLTTEHIKSNMEKGYKRVVSKVVHSAVLTDTNRFCAGIMNNGQIAVGTMPPMPSGAVVNFGSSVRNPVVMTKIASGIAVPVGGIDEYCDPVYGSSINVEEATYGSNCNGKTSESGVAWKVEDNNWIDNIKSRIDEKLPKNSVKIYKQNKDEDPAVGCLKRFNASYTCSSVDDTRIIDLPASSSYAVFECSDIYDNCTAAVLTLTDGGNLTLTNGTTLLWESNTTAVGISLDANTLNRKYGRNYLKTGEVLYPGDFIGSNSGNCILLCEKTGNTCSLSIVYYLWGCNAYDTVASVTDGSGSDGYITDINGFRATYSISEPNKDKSLNGKVIYINRDMERMTYPDSMLSLSDTYINAGNYAQSGQIITTSTSDLSGCKTKCNNNDECYGFIHYASNSRCELKKKTEIFPNKLNRILSNDAKMFIRKYDIANPTSCSGVIRNQNEETGATATKIPKGVNMTSSTKCMLARATSGQRDKVEATKSEVDKSTNKITTGYNELIDQNSELEDDLATTTNDIAKNFAEYDSLTTTDTSNLDSDNMSAMLSESNIENIRQNLNYMAWTSLATIAIFSIIKASR